MRKALVAFCILAVVVIVSCRFFIADGFEQKYSGAQKEITVINRGRPSNVDPVYNNIRIDVNNVANAPQSVKFSQKVDERQKEDFIKSVSRTGLFDIGNKNGYLRCDGTTCVGRLIFRRDVSRQEINDFTKQIQSSEYMSPNDREVYWVLDRKVDFNTDSKEEYVTIKFEKR